MFQVVRKSIHVLALFTLAGALCACGGSSADPARVTAVEALTGDATSGKTPYDKTCTSCHGADGKSGSEKRNIAADASGNKSGAIEQVLGGGGSMPAYADQFSDQEVADIVAYAASLE